MFRFLSFRFLIIGALELAVCWPSLRSAEFLGFSAGLCAFGFAFSGLEMILRRVIVVGEVRQGVLDSAFWAILKFLAPLGVMFFSMRYGGSVVALFLGMVCGLLNVAGILFFEAQTSAKKS